MNSPYIPVPVHPDVLEDELRQIRERYWATHERPGVAVITAMLNLGLVTYAVFRTIHSIFGPFRPGHWFGDGIAVLLFGSWLGMFIGMIVLGVVMQLVSGLCFLLTGRGMYPTETWHGQRLDDPNTGLVMLAGLAGVPLAEVIWVMTGLLR
ncbi:MAG TPA: hypothetical protein VF006_06285 [Longimicrobium sp.]